MSDDEDRDMFAPLQAVDVYPSVVGEFETDIGTTTETMEQALPNEVIASILDVLFGDQAMHTLATVASSNKMMYDLAIPRLYDIIRITDTNQDKLLFGCTDPRQGLHLDRTRKDRAMDKTRKMVLDNLISVPLASYYQYVATQSVSEVVVTPRCLAEAIKHTRKLPDIHTSLKLLAIRHIRNCPLHVTVQVEGDSTFQQLCQLVDHQPRTNNSFNIPITYDVFDMPTGTDLWHPLAIAFAMRAVVHFADHHSSAGPDDIARAISNQLLDCFKADSRSSFVTPGLLYLCDIPKLVLSPEELATSSNSNEVALLKLFDNLIYTPLPGALPGSSIPKPKWETFKSKVELVESGFRPGMSD